MPSLLSPVPHKHVTTAELVTLAQRGAPAKGYHDYDFKAGTHAILNPGEDTTLVNAAREMLDKLMLDMPSTRREFASSVVGAFPNIGAYASGDPECMWMPYATEDDYAPINIWVQVGASQGIVSDHKDALMKRGIVLMALAIALSERRPITLNCYHACSKRGGRDGTIVSWRVPTAPFVIAEVCTNLADPNVIRDVAYCANHGVALEHGYSGLQPAWLQGHDPSNPNIEQCAIDLGADPVNDIILAGFHLHDTLITHPIEWLNDKISQALKGRDAE